MQERTLQSKFFVENCDIFSFGAPFMLLGLMADPDFVLEVRVHMWCSSAATTKLLENTQLPKSP